MNMISEHFSYAEMTHTSRKLDNTPNAKQLANLKKLCDGVLEPLRKLVGKPIQINSAFRSKVVNKAVGGVGDSYHLDGLAADIVVEGMTARELYNLIRKSDIQYHKVLLEFETWVHIQIGRNGETPRLYGTIS